MSPRIVRIGGSEFAVLAGVRLLGGVLDHVRAELALEWRDKVALLAIEDRSACVLAAVQPEEGPLLGHMPADGAEELGATLCALALCELHGIGG